MQIIQLSPYSRNVPKFEASVTVSRELGNAAILSWVVYPKLDQNPCGNPWIAVSAGAPASPNANPTARQPTIAEIIPRLQKARGGRRFFECRQPEGPRAS